MRRIPVCTLALLTSLLPLPALAADWKMVFHDDFEREELGHEWIVGENGFIEGGKLHYGRHRNGIALIDRPFASDVRVEMIAESWPGRPPCDLSIALACPIEPRVTWGYLAAFGGQNNTLHQIVGGSQMPWVSVRYPPNLIEEGRVYAIAAQKDGNRISLEVNGEEILSTTDADLLGGPGYDHIGLVTWNGMLVDEVRVYERSTPNPATRRFLQPLEGLALGLDDQGKLALKIGAAIPEDVERACSLYNAGRYREAEEAFLAVSDAEIRAGGVVHCVGHVNYIESWQDCIQAGELLEKLAAAHPDDDRLRDYGLFGEQLTRMTLYKGAGIPNSRIAAHRIAAIGAENNPFYDKARFYQARFLLAQGLEAANREFQGKARRTFAELFRKYPENPSLREMNGERVPWGEELTITDESIPLWARSAGELYARQIAVLREWFTNRQFPDGQLGGGWGDDVEILRSWGPFAFISDGDPVVRDGIERMARGIWDADLHEWGFSSGFGDVEHSAEPSADTLPTMIPLRYGDPLWLERNMKTCRTIRDIYTGIDANGYRRFKSSFYGGDKVGQSIRDGGDTDYNGRTMKHMLWLAWYGNRGARNIYLDWVDGWLCATYREWAGKPTGVIPHEIWYPSGDIFPPGTKDWEADVGQYRGGPGHIGSAFLAAHKLTGYLRYLPPLHRIGRQRYEFSQDPNTTAQSLARAAQGMRYNFLSMTKEVLQTDRAVLPAANLSYRVFTGGTDNWRVNNLLTSAVNYDAPHARFAAMVVDASETAMTVWLYNLDDSPMDIGLRFWQFEPGNYNVRIGEIVSDDGEEPKYKWSSTDNFTYRRRADAYRMNLKPHEAYVLDFNHTERIDVEPFVPDLAIHDRDLALSAEGDTRSITATVHNVGSGPASNIIVSLEVSDGEGRREVDRSIIGRLDSPDDLWPKTVEVVFHNVPTSREYRVILDPENRIDEIYEGNNQAVLKTVP